MEPSSVQEEAVLPDDMLTLLGARCWLVEPNIIFTCKATLKGFERDLKSMTVSLTTTMRYCSLSSPLEAFERDLKKMENIYHLLERGEPDRVSEKDWAFVNVYVADIDYVKKWSYIQYEPKCLDIFSRMLKVVPLLNTELYYHHIDKNTLEYLRRWRYKRSKQVMSRVRPTSFKDIFIDRLAPSEEQHIDPNVPLLQQLDYSGGYLSSGRPLGSDNSIFISAQELQQMSVPPVDFEPKRIINTVDTPVERTDGEKAENVTHQAEEVFETFTEDSLQLAERQQQWYLDKNIRSMLKVLELLDDIVRNAPGCTTQYWYDSANRLLSCKEYLATSKHDEYVSFFRNLEKTDLVYYEDDEWSLLYDNDLNSKGRDFPHCIERPCSYLYLATAPLQCLEISNIVEKDPVTARSMFNFLKRGVVPTMNLTKYMYRALWKYEEFREDLSKHAIVFKLDDEQYEDVVGSKYSLDSRFLPGKHIKFASYTSSCHPLAYTKEELEAMLNKCENIELQVAEAEMRVVNPISWTFVSVSVSVDIYTFLEMVRDYQTRIMPAQRANGIPPHCDLRYQGIKVDRTSYFLPIVKILKICRYSPDFLEIIKILSHIYYEWDLVLSSCQVLEYVDLLPELFYDRGITLNAVYTSEDKKKQVLANTLSTELVLAPLKCKMSKNVDLQKWFDRNWSRLKEFDIDKYNRMVARECMTSMMPCLFWESRNIGVGVKKFFGILNCFYLYRSGYRTTKKLANTLKKILFSVYPDAVSSAIEEEFISLEKQINNVYDTEDEYD